MLGMLQLPSGLHVDFADSIYLFISCFSAFVGLYIHIYHLSYYLIPLFFLTLLKKLLHFPSIPLNHPFFLGFTCSEYIPLHTTVVREPMIGYRRPSIQ